MTLPLIAPRSVLTTLPITAVGTVDDTVSLSAAIERPPYLPTLIGRPAETVLSIAGTTIDLVAALHHTDAEAIRWANRIPDGEEPAPGSSLLVPPGPGALARVNPGERPSDFARRLGLDPRVVLDYNALSRDTPRSAGWLLIPLAAAPADALAAADFVLTTAGVPAVRLAPAGANGFPFGQCTWYAASRRHVTWSGNAVAWWSAARGIRPEGHIPIQGSIVVFNTGWFGHVAYVERVNANNTFEISEMNYFGAPGGGWGRVDHRTISLNSPGISGFIY